MDAVGLQEINYIICACNLAFKLIIHYDQCWVVIIESQPCMTDAGMMMFSTQWTMVVLWCPQPSAHVQQGSLFVCVVCVCVSVCLLPL